MSQTPKKQAAGVQDAPAVDDSVSEQPERKVECSAHKCHTSRGRIIKGQRIMLPSDEALELEKQGLVTAWK